MKLNNEVWSLWRADELVSVHMNDQDARDAREQHLDRYLDFVADWDVVTAAVQIRRIRLVDQPPPLVRAGCRRSAPDGGR